MSEELKKQKLVESGCDCGCTDEHCDCGDENCDCEDYGDIVELVDDEGKAMKFIHVATIDYENNWYVFFSPTEAVDGVTTDEVVIFRLEADEEGKDVFLPIEDEDLLQKVYDEYVKEMEEDDECGDDGDNGCGGECGGCSGCKH